MGCLPHQRPGAHAIALQDTDGRISPLTRASAPLSGEDHQEDYPQADLQRVQGRPPEADQAREALRDLRQEAQDQGPDVLDIILIVQSLVNLLQSNEFLPYQVASGGGEKKYIDVSRTFLYCPVSLRGVVGRLNTFILCKASFLSPPAGRVQGPPRGTFRKLDTLIPTEREHPGNSTERVACRCNAPLR